MLSRSFLPMFYSSDSRALEAEGAPPLKSDQLPCSVQMANCAKKQSQSACFHGYQIRFGISHQGLL